VSDSSAGVQATWLRIVAVLEGDEPDPIAVNESLTAIGGLRRDLDRIEYQLIRTARGTGLGWREIAHRLGLRSRQAAEQRYLRLSTHAEPDLGAVRKRLARRREMDSQAGADAARLRAAVDGLLGQLGSLVGSHDLDRRNARAAALLLAADTLRIAVDGEAGALYDLAAQAVTDLAGAPSDLRSDALDKAVHEVRAALDSVRPPLSPR